MATGYFATIESSGHTMQAHSVSSQFPDHKVTHESKLVKPPGC